MSDAELYMLAPQEDEAREIALGVATSTLSVIVCHDHTLILPGIESGEQKFTEVILSIQEYIADDDLTIRAKCKFLCQSSLDLLY